ncbi:DUF397 domain-containing protein [Sphaerisporangium sp. B11E5]|uniref:DUF397 domain-containing protein n=1 Tax=Sphaerisporangium sp. B11E5 TaxID=3153563 RepID=UPI00325D0428
MTSSPPDPYTHDLAAATWRKSSASAAEGDCIEVASLPTGEKAIRDSKNMGLGALRFTCAAWTAFRRYLRDGGF